MRFFSNLLRNIRNLFAPTPNTNQVYVINEESSSSSEFPSAKHSEIQDSEENENKLYPLIKAIKSSNMRGFLKKITRHNFDLVNQTDRDGNTILHYLAEKPNLTAARHVINLESFDLFTTNNEGKTALDLVIENIQKEDFSDPQMLVAIGRSIIRQVEKSYKSDEIPENFEDLKRTFREAREQLPNMKSGSISRNSEPSFSYRNSSLSPSKSISLRNGPSSFESLTDILDQNSSPKLTFKKSNQGSGFQR